MKEYLMQQHTQSQNDFQEAQLYIPGGVNSPVRAFHDVDETPIFYKEAQGCHVTDVDDNTYLDFICSWGPMILGHRPQAVQDAVTAQLNKGVSFGAPCEAEIKMAKKICEIVPSIDKVRMVSSGTEATMSAIRLARGYTKRNKLIKFQGNYHGHSDSLLVGAGSGVATLGIPGTPGVCEGAVQDTIVCQYNDLDSVACAFKTYPDDIAAIIVEPIAGNMGVVAPCEGFLEGLRELCDTHASVLIFDEVITGFRASLAGAQGLYHITPDLSCFGKIIGGGFPVGAFGGKAEIMDRLAPQGDVYQAGTLSGNPVAMEAGYAQLTELEKPETYNKLENLGARLENGLCDIIAKTRIQAHVNRVGSVATLFFTDHPVRTWNDAQTCNTQLFSQWFSKMLQHNILIAPSQFEALFISLAHSEKEIDMFLAAAEEVLYEMDKEINL